MSQTWIQWLRGVSRLTADTLSQQVYNKLYINANDPVFLDEAHLLGKLVIVTGANAGIGYETSRQLARAGATVILACRNLSKAETAMNKIQDEFKPRDVLLRSIELDLSSYESVRRFASKIKEENIKIDILILNGGVMAVKKTNPESHLLINHLSHALLTLLLIGNGSLNDQSNSRILFISSLMSVVCNLNLNDLHFNHHEYHWPTAYANSKLAMLLFMIGLNHRLNSATLTNNSKNIIVNAIHPGESASDVARYLGSISTFFHKRVLGPFMLLSVPQSARTSVYVAGCKNITQGGKFYHRISEEVDFPEHLTKDEYVQAMWNITLKEIGITEKELENLQPYLDLR